MKKSELHAKVTEAKSEMAEAVTTVLDAIGSPGQRKKTLAKEKVKKLCERLGIKV